MKVKRRLLNILTFVFAICIMSFGIYAAYSASLTMTGTVSFVAHDCEVEVLGTISGAMRIMDDEFIIVDEQTYNKGTENEWHDKFALQNSQTGLYTEYVPVESDGSTTWSIGDIYFDDIHNAADAEISPIVINLSVRNKSAFDVKVNVDTSLIQSNPSIYTYIQDLPRIPRNQTRDVKIVFSLLDSETDAQKINLDDVGVEFVKVVDPVIETDEDLGWVVTNQGELIGVPTAQNLGSETLTIPTSVYKEIDEFEEFSAVSKATPLNTTKDGKTKIDVVSIGLMEGNTSPLFDNTYGYTKVVIPAGVRILADNAFAGCSDLTDVVIPETLESIQSRVFEDCTNINFNVDDMGNRYLGVDALTKFALIYGPAEAEDIVVSSQTKIIANDAFTSTAAKKITLQLGTTDIGDKFQGSNIEEIVIPETVDSLPEGAFQGCENLTNVDLPSNMTNIGNEAFSDCKNLVNIELPKDVESIGDNAFSGCDNLTSIDLPSNVNNIGNGAFEGCSSLENITWPSGNQLTDIGENAFAGTGISDVTLPSGLTNIGDGAFANCENLTSVNAGDVLVIGKNAFANNPNIKDIDASQAEQIGPGAFKVEDDSKPDTPIEITPFEKDDLVIGEEAFTNTALNDLVFNGSVKSIGDYAFYNCNFLNTVTFNEVVESVGIFAFASCVKFTKLTIRKDVLLFKNDVFTDSPRLRTLVIDDQTMANKLIDETSMGNMATSARMIFIKEDVTVNSTTDLLNEDNGKFLITELDPTEIEDYTGYTKYLSTKNLEESYEGWVVSAEGVLTEVPTSAELGTLDLKIPTFIIDSNDQDIIITQIGNGSSAVKNINNYNTVYIPQSVKTVANNAFNGTSNIKAISLPKQLKTIGDYSFKNCTGITELVIPDSVTSLGKYSLQKTNITSITIPENITNVAYGLFADSPNLLNVTVKGNLEFVDKYAFTNCQKLQSVTFEGDVDTIRTKAFSSDSTSTYNKLLNTVEFKGSLNIIDAQAFYYCSGLTNINLPEGLASIGTYGLEGTAVENVELPHSLKVLGSGAFLKCSNLKTVTINSDLLEMQSYAFACDSNLESVVVNGKLSLIGSFAFSKFSNKETYCTSLKSITFNDKVKEIGEYAFYGAGLETLKMPDGLQTIGAQAFRNNKSLTEVQMPSTLTKLSNYVFADCINLTTFKCSSTLETIGDYAFYNTTSLSKIELPKSLKTINQYGFYKSGLTSINIPEGTTTVGASAFDSNSKLLYISFPSTVTAISKRVVASCASLKSVTFNGHISSMGDYAVGHALNLEKVTFNADVDVIGVRAFSSDSASNYSAKLKNVIFNGKVTSIGNNAFEGAGFETINIPEGLTNLGQYAFYKCPNLTSIKLPDSLQTINTWTFGYCSNLAVIELPNNLTTIKTRAFQECGVQELIIPASLTTMEANIFQGCNKLTTATFKGDIATLAKYTFGFCTTLETVNFEGNVGTIAYKAFSGEDTKLYCKNLKNVNFKGTVTKIEERAFEGSGIQSITLPEGLTTLGVYVFYNCINLTDVNLPNSLTSAGTGVFEYCTSLEEIEVPTGLTNIPTDMFQNCPGLKKVTFNGDMTTSGEGVFDACYALETIIFKGDVKQIGPSWCVSEGSPWAPCTNLKTITFEKTVETIKEKAFWGCTSLEELTLPGIKSIGYQAFMNCSNLKTLNISGNLTTDYEVFMNCTSLTNLTMTGENIKLGHRTFKSAGFVELDIPQGVTTLGDGVFSFCQKLTRVSTPTSLNMLTQDTFHNCNYLQRAVINGDLTTAGEGVFDLCVELESVTFKGIVKEIAYSMFTEGETTPCTKLKTVIFEKTVEKIGENAFYGCIGLESISLPGIVTIVTKAFKNCYNLSNVEFDTTLRTIGAEAFYNTAFIDLTLPEGLTSISTNTFSNCAKLQSITFPTTLTSYPANGLNNCTALTDVVVKGNVTTFGNSMLINNTALINATFEGDVTTFGDNVFDGCTSLETVRFKGAVGKIGNSSFIWEDKSLPCTNLKNLIFETSVTEIGTNTLMGLTSLETLSLPGIVKIGARAFDSCTNLKTVEFPTTLTTIDEKAFANCTSLVNFTLPESLTTVGSGAFLKCNAIENITLPSTLKTTGNNMFESCVNLKTVQTLADDLTLSNYTFGYCTSLHTIDFKGTVKAINYKAFSGTDKTLDLVNLKNVTFHKTVTTVGERAFEGTGLETITLPGVTSIGTYAFINCKNLVDLNLPTTLKTIYKGAFQDCSALVEVHLPEGLTQIGDCAFMNCIELETVYMPSTITQMGVDVFKNCPKFKTLRIPEGTVQTAPNQFINNTTVENIIFPSTFTTIGNGTFIGCTGLTNLVLPDTITTIGANAFKNCTNLQSVTLPTSLQVLDESAFLGCTSLKEIVIPQTVEKVSAYAFKGCTALETITVNNTTIGANAFENCTALTNIILADSVTVIGDYAFAGCTGLQTITLPESELYIGNYAFSGCTTLTSVVVPEGLVSIGDYAFYNCTALNDFDFPQSLQIIGSNAFAGCTAFVNIELPNKQLSIGTYAFQNTGITTYTFPSAFTTIPEGMFANCASLQSVDLGSVEVIGADAFKNCTNLKTVTVNNASTATDEAYTITAAGRIYENADVVYFKDDITYAQASVYFNKVFYPIESDKDGYIKFIKNVALENMVIYKNSFTGEFYMQMGKYNNIPIVWEVLGYYEVTSDTEEQTVYEFRKYDDEALENNISTMLVLFSKYVITDYKVSSSGASDLYEYMNYSFYINSFTGQERPYIVEKTYTYGSSTKTSKIWTMSVQDIVNLYTNVTAVTKTVNRSGVIDDYWLRDYASNTVKAVTNSMSTSTTDIKIAGTSGLRPAMLVTMLPDVEIDSTDKNYSPEQIRVIADDPNGVMVENENGVKEWQINGKTYLTVGDLITFTMNDANKTVMSARLIDINHDTGANGNTVPFTFVTEQIYTTYKMYSSNASSGGFRDSLMRSYLQSTVFNYLPEGLKNSITTVRKYTTMGGNNYTDMIYSDDALFLLSRTEVGLSATSDSSYKNADKEGFAYAYFTDDASRIKINVTTGEPGVWWLRTPQNKSGDGICFDQISVVGKSNGGGRSENASGLVFAFCIGTPRGEHVVKADTTQYTAEEINAIANDPFAKIVYNDNGVKEWRINNITYLKVGDLVSITMDDANSTVVNFRLIDIGHDVYSGDGENIPFTFFTEDLYTSKYMNGADTSNGGWPNSALRSYLNSTIYNALPEAWRNIIVPAKKVTKQGGQTNATQVSYDNLFALSMREVGYSTYAVNEGSKYAYFLEGDSAEAKNLRIRKYAGTTTTECWWLRGPNYTNTDYAYSTYFRLINSAGYSERFDARRTNGVTFAFCVGTPRVFD